MHNSFTDGTILDVPSMCGYCQMTTGGRHQLCCPAFPPIHKQYEVGVDISKVRICKYDDDGNFIKEL